MHKPMRAHTQTQKQKQMQMQMHMHMHIIMHMHMLADAHTYACMHKPGPASTEPEAITNMP